MTLYERVASTEAGSLALAEARLRREALRCLVQAMAVSGVDRKQLAARLGERPGKVARVLHGDGDITMAVLARYLHAMGHEAEITLVPAGEPRRKAVEADGHGQGCGTQPEPADREQVKAYLQMQWAKASLQVDPTPLPMLRPECQYRSMMDPGAVRAALDRLQPEDMDVAKRQLRELREG